MGTRGRNRQGKAVLALSAATATAAEDAATAAASANDDFRGAGLSHGQNTIAESSVTTI
jgi:hypothetical protein